MEVVVIRNGLPGPGGRQDPVPGAVITERLEAGVGVGDCDHLVELVVLAAVNNQIIALLIRDLLSHFDFASHFEDIRQTQRQPKSILVFSWLLRSRFSL